MDPEVAKLAAWTAMSLYFISLMILCRVFVRQKREIKELKFNREAKNEHLDLFKEAAKKHRDDYCHAFTELTQRNADLREIKVHIWGEPVLDRSLRDIKEFIDELRYANDELNAGKKLLAETTVRAMEQATAASAEMDKVMRANLEMQETIRNGSKENHGLIEENQRLRKEIQNMQRNMSERAA